MLTRRSLVAAGVFALGAPAFNRGRFSLFARPSDTYSTRAIEIIRESNVIDMMGLLTLNYSKLLGWARKPESFSEADFKRLRDSGTTVFHPAVGFTQGDIYGDSYRDIRAWNLFNESYVALRDLLKNGGQVHGHQRSLAPAWPPAPNDMEFSGERSESAATTGWAAPAQEVD